jgi:DnaJ-class molecular chaperone
MSFAQRPSRRAPILLISLDATCIECHGEPRPDDSPCPRCWGMTRRERAEHQEETRRLLSAAFTTKRAS